MVNKLDAALQLSLAPPQKNHSIDPFVFWGRHFARTINALCDIDILIANGVTHLGDLPKEPEESFTAQERREHKMFLALLETVPGLEKRLINTSSKYELSAITTLLQKGADSARLEDTRSLKPIIIDWLVVQGKPLVPPLSRNVKVDRGFNHDVTGALLCPAGLDWSNPDIKEQLKTGVLSVQGNQWPLMLYASYKHDKENPWKGLLRSSILVKTFKHIFTSSSSVEREVKATQSGSAQLHGTMTSVTCGSIAYTAAQARFAISSSSVFKRSNTITESEKFYNSILDLLQEPDEVREVNQLIKWWNQMVFPNYSKLPSKNSVIAKIKAKRAATKEAAPEKI